MEVFLNGVVQLVIGLECAGEDAVDKTGDEQQRKSQQRQYNAVNNAQLRTDTESHNHGHNQHHGAADAHTDHHLKGHLQIRHIGGQTGDNAGGGEFVDVGKVEGLDIVEHVMAQVPGKAGTGMRGKYR